jgi:hypothetical protein
LCTGSGKKVASWVAVDADLHEADTRLDALGKDMRLDWRSAMLHSDPWMDVVADAFPRVVVVPEEKVVDILGALVVRQKRTTKERHHLR